MAKAKPLNVPHKALHSRVSYLYQAAAYLATLEPPSTATHVHEAEGHQQEVGHEDGQHTARSEPQLASSQVLSRQLLSDLRCVSQKMQIRLSPAMKHAICKRCDTMLLEGSTCTAKVENKSKNGKKPWADVLVRICSNCGCERRFPVNADRQPRRPYRLAKDSGARIG